MDELKKDTAEGLPAAAVIRQPCEENSLIEWCQLDDLGEFDEVWARHAFVHVRSENFRKGRRMVNRRRPILKLGVKFD